VRKPERQFCVAPCSGRAGVGHGHRSQPQLDEMCSRACACASGDRPGHEEGSFIAVPHAAEIWGRIRGHRRFPLRRPSPLDILGEAVELELELEPQGARMKPHSRRK